MPTRGGKLSAVECGLVFLLPSAPQAIPQYVTGSTTGTVLDSSEAAVPSAEVILTNDGTGETQRTVTGNLGELVSSDIGIAARFNPAGNQVSGRFGLVTVARPPRIMQLGLKFRF
jgi:hypothetical protein